MVVRTVIAVAALFALFFPPWFGSRLVNAPNQENTENAAVKYLRADAALRQSYALPPDAAPKLEKALESPLDGEDRKLVAAAEDALVELDHGASDKRCDWAVSVEDGPLANTAHRGAIRELVAVSGLRARLRFVAGDTPGAMSDALAAIAAARHLSMDRSIASVLIAYKLENMTATVLAQNLGQFSPAQLRELVSGLDALPHGSSLSSALESEKLNRNDLSAIVQGAKTRDELVGRLLARVPTLQSNRVLAEQIVDGCGGSVEGFLKCADQQISLYALWEARFSWSPEHFESAYNADLAEVSKTNPVIRQFTPSLTHLRWAEAYCQTRRALLQAAVFILLDGQSALNRYLDPYDARPFSSTSVDGGFRLGSRLTENGIPLSLSAVPNSDHVVTNPK